MRAFPAVFSDANEQLRKTPYNVVEIEYAPGDSDYFTSHANITGVPATRVDSVVQNVSGSTQTLDPVTARASIGAMSATLVDAGSTVTTRINARLDGGQQVKDSIVRFHAGLTADFNEFVVTETQIADDNLIFSGGLYTLRCSDIQRQMKRDVFDAFETNLSASITDTQTTIDLVDASGLGLVVHGTSYTDAPSQTVGYIQIEDTKEIIRFTGISFNQLTGCTRGVFSTTAQAVDVDPTDDPERRPRVSEYIYLELPLAKCIYAILTGELEGQAATLPDNYHLGIDTSLVALSEFTSIGADLWDTTDDSMGFKVRFEGLTKTSGKQFIESELLRLGALFSPVLSNGQLGLRRLSNIGPNASYVAVFNSSNMIGHNSINYNLRKQQTKFRVNWNWNGEEYLRSTDLITAVDDSGLVEFNFRGLHGGIHTDQIVKDRLNGYRDRFAGPPFEMTVTTNSTTLGVENGDVVRVIDPNVRDVTTGSVGLDRTFEVQNVQVDRRRGRIKYRLFGSSAQADAVPGETPPGYTPPLADGGYVQGTELTAAGVSITGTTVDPGTYTLTGAVTTGAGSRFHFLDDLTIPVGATLNIENNVVLFVRGFVTVNGSISGLGRGLSGVSHQESRPPALGTPGYLGNTHAGGGLRNNWDTISDDFDQFATHQEASTTVGQVSSVPFFSVEIDDSDEIQGLPDSLMGTSGGPGAPVYVNDLSSFADPPELFHVSTGGTGGDGGSGFILVCRGLAFGVNGTIDLSGGDGAVGLVSSVDTTQQQAGSGAGGAPGGFLCLLDGSDLSIPDLSTGFIANNGDTPIGPNPLIGFGTYRWSDLTSPFSGYYSPQVISGGAVDAARIQYLPDPAGLPGDPGQPITPDSSFEFAATARELEANPAPASLAKKNFQPGQVERYAPTLLGENDDTAALQDALDHNAFVETQERIIRIDGTVTIPPSVVLDLGDTECQKLSANSPGNNDAIFLVRGTLQGGTSRMDIQHGRGIVAVGHQFEDQASGYNTTTDLASVTGHVAEGIVSPNAINFYLPSSQPVDGLAHFGSTLLNCEAKGGDIGYFTTEISNTHQFISCYGENLGRSMFSFRGSLGQQAQNGFHHSGLTKITVSSVVGTFEYNEELTGSTSGPFRGFLSTGGNFRFGPLDTTVGDPVTITTTLYVRRLEVSPTIGETITGNDSGATCVVDSVSPLSLVELLDSTLTTPPHHSEQCRIIDVYNEPGGILSRDYRADVNSGNNEIAPIGNAAGAILDLNNTGTNGTTSNIYKRSPTDIRLPIGALKIGGEVVEPLTAAQSAQLDELPKTQAELIQLIQEQDRGPHQCGINGDASTQNSGYLEMINGEPMSATHGIASGAFDRLIEEIAVSNTGSPGGSMEVRIDGVIATDTNLGPGPNNAIYPLSGTVNSYLTNILVPANSKIQIKHDLVGSWNDPQVWWQISRQPTILSAPVWTTPAGALDTFVDQLSVKNFGTLNFVSANPDETYSIVSGNVGDMAIGSAGSFTYTPTSGEVAGSPYSVVLRATNSEGSSDSTLTVTVSTAPPPASNAILADVRVAQYHIGDRDFLDDDANGATKRSNLDRYDLLILAGGSGFSEWQASHVPTVMAEFTNAILFKYQNPKNIHPGTDGIEMYNEMRGINSGAVDHVVKQWNGTAHVDHPNAVPPGNPDADRWEISMYDGLTNSGGETAIDVFLRIWDENFHSNSSFDDLHVFLDHMPDDDLLSNSADYDLDQVNEQQGTTGAGSDREQWLQARIDLLEAQRLATPSKIVGGNGGGLSGDLQRGGLQDPQTTGTMDLCLVEALAGYAGFSWEYRNWHDRGMELPFIRFCIISDNLKSGGRAIWNCIGEVFGEQAQDGTADVNPITEDQYVLYNYATCMIAEGIFAYAQSITHQSGDASGDWYRFYDLTTDATGNTNWMGDPTESRPTTGSGSTMTVNYQQGRLVSREYDNALFVAHFKDRRPATGASTSPVNLTYTFPSAGAGFKWVDAATGSDFGVTVSMPYRSGVAAVRTAV